MSRNHGSQNEEAQYVSSVKWELRDKGGYIKTQDGNNSLQIEKRSQKQLPPGDTLISDLQPPEF